MILSILLFLDYCFLVFLDSLVPSNATPPRVITPAMPIPRAAYVVTVSTYNNNNYKNNMNINIVMILILLIIIIVKGSPSRIQTISTIISDMVLHSELDI